MASNVIPISSFAPRAPIVYNSKSGSMDLPDNYVASCRAWRQIAREEAMLTLKLNPERDFVKTYTDFQEGRYTDRRVPRYRSRFFDNRLADARLQALCALTDIRPSMEIGSNSTVEAYLQQAQILLKIIHSIWDEENLDLATEALVDHALLSVGYWKVGATMATSTIPARMLVTPCGMDMVLPIQPGRDIQDSTAVLYRYYSPIHKIKLAYGQAADGIEREVTGNYLNYVGGSYPDYTIPSYSFNATDPSSRMNQPGRAGISMAQDAGGFPSGEVEEYWIDDPSINESRGDVLVKDPRLALSQHNYHYVVPPGERLFPRKRLQVWCGSKILYDGPAPFWHGLYPFPQLVLRPAVWRYGGISAYRSLTPLQLAMNEVGAGTLDLVKRVVDPQMAFEDGALDDTSFRQFYPDRYGAQIKMKPNKQWGANAKYIDPPVMPAYVSVFMQQVSQAFDRQMGALDTAGMMRKNQVPGGDTVEQFRDSAQAVYRLDSRHIEPFMRDAAKMFVSNIFQFWTREQRMYLLGKDGMTWYDFVFDPTMIPFGTPKEDHWKRFNVKIAAGSMHGGQRDRLKQTAIALYRINAIDRETLLETLGWANIPKVMERLAQQAQEMPPVAPHGTGKGASPRLTRGDRNPMYG